MRSETTSDTGVRADTPSTYQTRRRVGLCLHQMIKLKLGLKKA